LTAIVSKEKTGVLGSTIGGNEYLAKPVTTEELIETIERVLGG
jgi:DNA-binding response OmpR family regulator